MSTPIHLKILSSNIPTAPWNWKSGIGFGRLNGHHAQSTSNWACTLTYVRVVVSICQQRKEPSLPSPPIRERAEKTPETCHYERQNVPLSPSLPTSRSRKDLTQSDQCREKRAPHSYGTGGEKK